MTGLNRNKTEQDKFKKLNLVLYLVWWFYGNIMKDYKQSLTREIRKIFYHIVEEDVEKLLSSRLA